MEPLSSNIDQVRFSPCRDEQNKMIFLVLNELRVSYEVNWLILVFQMEFGEVYQILFAEPCLIWMHHKVTTPLNLHIPKLYTRPRLYIYTNIIQDFLAQNYVHHWTLKMLSYSEYLPHTISKKKLLTRNYSGSSGSFFH